MLSIGDEVDRAAAEHGRYTSHLGDNPLLHILHMFKYLTYVQISYISYAHLHNFFHTYVKISKKICSEHIFHIS